MYPVLDKDTVEKEIIPHLPISDKGLQKPVKVSTKILTFVLNEEKRA